MKNSLVAAIAASVLALPSLALAEQETTKVWQVDKTGKPPYQRRLVEVPVADMARMEPVATERVWTREYTGRPPFRRGYKDLPVFDVASMEAGSSSEPYRPEPFFKTRHQ